MAVIQKITLTNFKGAASVSLDLAGKIDCPVTTLIGLNESGKTTILEGLSHFISGDTDVSSLFEVPKSSENQTALIPIHKKAAFSGDILIEAIVNLDKEDIAAMIGAAANSGYIVETDTFPTKCKITRVYTYDDSIQKTTVHRWGLSFKATNKKKTAKTVVRTKEYKGPSTGVDLDVWRMVIGTLSTRLPKISYFPTFLVGLPKKIYLKQHKDESAVNRYYRNVLQDVLDSLNEGLYLEKHVCKRIEDYANANQNPVWFSNFWSSSTKPLIDSVVQKIGNAVTREVLGSWKNVFQLPISAKDIKLDWQVDAEKNNLPYVSFYVTDGESSYEISERSLGFRWFFSFLLFTSFKKAKSRPTLMLFDEPAANLHAKAQAELLKSFAKIVKDGNRIVYSTHSHHMIEPQWLSGAYIVENTAIDFDSNDAFDLNTQPTNVKATSYRQFVSSFPNRSSYFQPVIEKLGYVTPEILGTSPFVIVEGISDYYALKILKDSNKKFKNLSILPGVGAGSSGAIISLLLSRGEKFILLFDDDKEGNIQAKRSKEQWLLSDNSVFTLVDISTDFSGMQIESLLCIETIAKIKQWLNAEEKPTKKQIGIYLAEHYSKGVGVSSLGDKTISNLSQILSYCESVFAKT